MVQIICVICKYVWHCSIPYQYFVTFNPLWFYHFFDFLGNTLANGLQFYTEENAYMVLLNDTKQNYSYWDQECRGDKFSFNIL